MSTITDNLSTTQDQILEAIEKIQEPVVEAVRTVAEAVEGVLPEDRPSVPFADSLPEPKELVELSVLPLLLPRHSPRGTTGRPRAARFVAPA